MPVNSSEGGLIAYIAQEALDNRFHILFPFLQTLSWRGWHAKGVTGVGRNAEPSLYRPSSTPLSKGRVGEGRRRYAAARKLFNLLCLGGVDQLGSVLSDHQLFVGGDDPDLDLGVGGGDDQSPCRGSCSASGSSLTPMKSQAVADHPAADPAVVLAYAGSEGRCASMPFMSGGVSADVLGRLRRRTSPGPACSSLVALGGGHRPGHGSRRRRRT